MKKLIVAALLSLVASTAYAQVRALGSPQSSFPFSFSTDPYAELFDGRLLNTIDNTPTTFPLIGYEVDANQAIYFELRAMVIVPGFASAAGGRIIGMCGRNTGNLLCLVGSATLDFTFFTAPQPVINVTADTVNNRMQLVLTGKAATQLGWYISIRASRTN